MKPGAKDKFRIALIALLGAAALVAAGKAGAQSPPAPPPPSLMAGFDDLYRLQFAQGREIFRAYERAHPDDPVGESAEASSFLFEEFNRKHVLTSDFFLDDKKFLGGIPDKPDADLCKDFEYAANRARADATAQLKKNPRDPRALLALTLTDGLTSDYESLILKHQLAGVHYLKASEEEAGRLLAIQPDAQDAYIALGAANYVIGSLPSYKRAFLWFGGVHGDRVRGIQQLEQAAARGNYLRPFARIMLALALLREKQPARARDLFAELAKDYPENPQYAKEYAQARKSAGGP
ncbi:MAG: tetratricopeptide repeat protein [Candidatus Acidiferrales bacterium]